MIKMKFCCERLKFKLSRELDEHILYLPQTRSYQIIGARFEYEGIDISHCPWCGAKLPEDLTDRLVSIVYEELKLDSYDDPRLPEQFKSDRWWQELRL